MSDITTVTLELLRLGPPHNQLLSPLTRYLGVCGNHRAEEVCVPWEHRDFTSALEVLRYQGPSNVKRLDELRRLGQDVTGVICHVEGLKNQLSEANAQDRCRLIQLELVLSASELAMLPFEATRTFPGGPGSDEQYLVIQPNAEIEITRRDRGVVTDQAVRWPEVPKILFIAAQPEGMTVPFDAHLTALMQAISPYLGAHEDSPAGVLAASAQFLTVLPAASIDEIQDICSRERFSYVHILAHGLQADDIPGMPFGLALHAGRGQQTKEIVSGDRLAVALRARGHTPAVVTVAACDSGNVNDVIHSGASLAHDLHRVGLPLVVASQYPLSFEGSIEMVEQVYQRLPHGEDPRMVLHDLRRRLYARYGAKTHDWASLVVYAALPADIESQLRRTGFRSASARIYALLDRIDTGLDEDSHDGEQSHVAQSITDDAEIEAALDWLPREGEWKIEAEALRASVTKRMAQLRFMAGKREYDSKHEDCGAHAKQHWDDSLIKLRRARQHYRTAASLSLGRDDDIMLKRPPMQWLLIQELSLSAVFGEDFDAARWCTALISCRADLDSNREDVEVGALSSFIELYLLLWAWPDAIERSGQGKSDDEVCDEMMRACDDLIDRARNHGSNLVPVQTRRQLERYVNWMWSEELIEHQRQQNTVRKIPTRGENTIVGLAQKLIERLDRV